MTLLTLLLALSAQASTVESATATTIDGRRISVQINVPELADAKAPALVIAPGAGYHMDLPLIKELAEKAASNGVVAYRFNWEYFTREPRGEASDDLEVEIKDMQAVIALARSDARVNPARLLVAGKSLGSLVAYPVFLRDPSLSKLALLTPVCTYTPKGGEPAFTGDENYPGLSKVERPVFFASSDRDPLCKPAHLERLLGARFPFSVVGGDHSWNVVPDFNDPRNQTNRALGLERVWSWLAL